MQIGAVAFGGKEMADQSSPKEVLKVFLEFLSLVATAAVVLL
jgi:hypothetical protein